ncbi:MAG: amidohydrolase [Halobacteriaceae archaeon]
MTDPADLILRNAEVHSLAPTGDTVTEAVAIRDGRIVRVDSDYEVEFLEGTETTVRDCQGRVVLPGFIDAHTHLTAVGRYAIHADLRRADSPGAAIEILSAHAAETSGWVQGYGFDESTWTEDRYLTREDLDAVSPDRPVLALREDGHTAAVNSVVLERFEDDLPPEGTRTEGGDPTGVLVEDAVEVVREAVSPDREETRALIEAAQKIAHSRGVTGIHDMVRQSHAPAVYRELALADTLRLRVRLNYWSDHLEAAVETGLRTNHGGPWVRTGAIKSFTDGSFGGRTAKVSEPYADASEDSATGQWVVDPEALDSLVERATDAGFQVALHAIGDDAVEVALDVYEAYGTPTARHRIEHAELADDEMIQRFADAGVVASMQPNFLKWAREDGLYERRLGEARAARTDRLGAFAAADVPLALGSDCMPMDPLVGIHQAVTAPRPDQRLSVTAALRGYTHGAAVAGFDEDRMGTITEGHLADLVVLDSSPWEHEDAIEDIAVTATIVDGEIVDGAL